MKPELRTSKGIALVLQGQILPSCLYALFWIQESCDLFKYSSEKGIYLSIYDHCNSKKEVQIKLVQL